MLFSRSRFLGGVVALKLFCDLIQTARAMSTAESASINVAPFLSPDYDHRGNLLRLKDNTEFYACGDASHKHGVILVPDMLGWNTGRIRNIADFFASQGCIAAIPKLSGSTESATTGPSYFESSGIGDYMKSLTFESNLKPKISSVVKYMQQQGVDKIALIGFNWGGWVVTNILASELADQFVCGALPHPSINLEERVYGGSLLELMSRVDRPLLLMPAKGDPDEYRQLLKMMKFKLPTSDVIDYHNLEHGFLLRGTVADPEIRQACDKSLREIMNFFNLHFQMDPDQLVHRIEKEGFTKETSRPKTLYERVGEVGQWAAEKLSLTGENVQEGSEYAKVQSAKLGQDTGKAVQQWKEQAERAADQDVPQRIQQSQDQLGEKAQSTAEYIKENAGKFGEKVQQTGEYLGDQAKQTYEKGKQSAQQMGDWTSDQAKSAYEKGKQSAHETGDQLQQGYDKAKESTKQTGEQVNQKAKEGYDQAKDTGKQVYEKGKEQAQQTSDKTKDYASKTGEAVGEKTKQTGEQIKRASSPKDKSK